MVTATVKSNHRMAKKDASAAKTVGQSRPNRRVPTQRTPMLSRPPGLKNTLAQIEKEFGEGAIMPLGSDHAAKIEGIPTGSLSLDIALGGQGIPKG